MTTIDKDSITNAYEAVRADDDETQWAVMKFEGNEIVLDSTGTEYEEFVSKFAEDERAFGFVRMQTGDEMSRRSKFALITWVGPAVSPLKKAKMSTDKGVIKTVLHSYAIEILSDELEDIQEDKVRNELIRAGGANYGTGDRE